MRVGDLGQYRIKGGRKDGWLVVITVSIIDGTNTFEIHTCASCGVTRVRAHDAEAWRLEREAKS